MNPLQIALMTTAALLILSGLYLLLRTIHVLRLIMALLIVMKAVTLMIIFVGWYNGQLALAESLAISAIVVEFILLIVGIAIAMIYLKRHGSWDLVVEKSGQTEHTPAVDDGGEKDS